MAGFLPEKICMSCYANGDEAHACGKHYGRQPKAGECVACQVPADAAHMECATHKERVGRLFALMTSYHC
jgi:ribosomal protein L40E